MRFSELHLIRYGQFDGCRLAFPQMASDLHVVYGANETGKSTTMSAIADLLFGFPRAAAYDFQFDKLLLRVGGVIDGSGESLTYRRKRGNVRTLLDVAEQPLDEGPLAALLNGQTRESFLRAFSLDHSRLRDGGRAMLDAKDDVGQAIFAAGSGLVGVTRLAEALDEEAKAIWSERASATRLYYMAQKVHDEARSRLRDTQLKSAYWAELKKVLDSHERELRELRAQRDGLQAARQRTERRRRVLAPIARRSHLLNQLAMLGSVPDLPTDARTVAELASRQIAEAETTARLTGEQAAAARKQLGELTYDPALLNRRGQVLQLRAQQGAVDKAIRDTPGLETKAAAADEQLVRLLREVGWPKATAAEVQARLPGRPQVNELRALLEEYRALESNRDTAHEELDEQSRLASDLRRQLETLPSTATSPAFAAVFQNIRSQGDIEAAAATARMRHERARGAVNNALENLIPWRGTVNELATLFLPNETKTSSLSEALVAAQEELASACRALLQLRDDHDHRELRRAQLLRDEHAVSSDMLHAARHARDTTWRYVSDHVGVATLASSSDIQQKFSEELRTADDLADRRFDGAKTSASLVALEQDLERLQLSLLQAEKRRLAAEDALAATTTAWTAATGAIGEPISPDALKVWRTGRLRAIELAEAERIEAEEAARRAEAIETARGLLVSVLPAATGDAFARSSLAALLHAAGDLEVSGRQIRDQTVALQGQIKTADEATQRAQARRDDASRRLDAWRGRWSGALTSVGLPPEGSHPLIRARLDLMDELRSLSDSVLGYERRIHDIGDDVAAFGAQVRALAADFGLQDAAAEPSGTLRALEQRLETIATLAERADGLRTQLRDTSGREAEAKRAAELAHAALSPLLIAAKVDDSMELGGVIERVETAKQLRAEIQELTRSILELGDGLGLDDLLDEAAGEDAAELAAESDRLQDQMRTQSVEIERIAELRQAAYLQFKQGDDRPDAAIAAADVAQARAEMEAQAESYVRKRTEAALLRWTIERYRREKQAPLLKRASAIFSELTLGRYGALGVDVEEGRPRLSGIRADGSTVVPVSGMSEGTVDQLFLSLRLAAIEESVAAGVKLPFLADDLFINYDDARSAAGFRVLAKLAEQTQVLFFTHHEHLADLARAALGSTGVSTCSLGELKMDAA